MEATEFEKAIKQHVHIVNEYFLRLMIKYWYVLTNMFIYFIVNMCIRV